MPGYSKSRVSTIRKEVKRMADISMHNAIKMNLKAFRLLYTKKPSAFVSSGISILFEILSPFAEIYLSAQILNELAGDRNAERLWRLIGITIGVTAILEIGKYFLVKWRDVANTDGYFLRRSIYAGKMMDMNYEDVENPKIRDLVSLIRQNEQWGNRGLGQIIYWYEVMMRSVLRIVCALLLLKGFFGEMQLESVLLFLILFLFALLTSMFSNKGNVCWAHSDESSRLGNRIFNFNYRLFSEHDRSMDIRIYKQEKQYEGVEANKAFSTNSQIAREMRGIGGICFGLSSAFCIASLGAVYVVVCISAWNGAFGMGTATQYIGAITALAAGISDLAKGYGDVRINVEFLKPVFEYLELPDSMYQGSLTTEKRTDRKYEVEFRDVSFKYPTASEYALRHVSMKFNIGERLAIVGMNGSGKTTFIKLLCRLYDPTEGQILLNGIDIRKYRYDEYMQIFSVVFQDFRLLALPLGENIATGCKYDERKVLDCLEKAGYGERLRSMPEGLHTYLYHEYTKEGVEISGGEAQKIAIARALYKDAPFIILDEPTAALDPLAEYEIYTRFNEIVEDKTAIYISHRLSSCRFCDTIAVFDQGTIVQRGNHEALVADTSGKYYELWNAQAQYYQ